MAKDAKESKDANDLLKLNAEIAKLNASTDAATALAEQRRKGDTKQNIVNS